MKIETIEKAKRILNNIDHHEYTIKELIRRRDEYKHKGYFKIDGVLGLDLKIPFEVFSDWFRAEVEINEKKIQDLKKEFDLL